MTNNDYKRCPRCGQKVFSVVKSCTNCGLKFDRLSNLSNKEAKKAIKNGKKENILYVTTPPSDVNKKKFLLLFWLLGIFGAHNIYVGKYKRGFYSLITVIAFIVTFIISDILFTNGIDTSSLQYYIVGPFTTFAVFGILIWFIDLVPVVTKSFKYPATMSSEEIVDLYLKSKVYKNSHKKNDVKNYDNYDLND